MKKVVLVTGGSRGIGKAICEKFAAEGYAVAVNFEKSEEKAKALAEKIGGKAFCADVSDYSAVCRMFDEIEKEMGEVSVLVNNAAISTFGLFQDCSDGEWERIFGVNVKGVFNCCQAVLPEMIKKQSGKIINVSSMWGVTGASCEVHYSAAKAGVIGLTKALAKEVAPSGVTVNAIAPGIIDTSMNADISVEDLAAFVDSVPLGRMGTADEVAQLCFFLASDAASYITGAVLPVDGGLSAGFVRAF